jgi:hypothetical protein
MGKGRYIHSGRALIWFDPDAGTLSIDIFDISRDELEALPTAGPERMLEIGGHPGSQQVWCRDIKPPKRIRLTAYTNEPPVEESTP